MIHLLRVAVPTSAAPHKEKKNQLFPAYEPVILERCYRRQLIFRGARPRAAVLILFIDGPASFSFFPLPPSLSPLSPSLFRSPIFLAVSV